MRLSAEGLALICRFEGFSAMPYRCPAGYLTIGYGHVLRPQEMKVPLDEGQARELLQRDVRVAERAVARLIAVPLRQAQFDALVSFTYNLGAACLQRSTLRQRLNRGEVEAVPEQMRRYVWAGGKKLAGLERRRADEAALFSNGSAG